MPGGDDLRLITRLPSRATPPAPGDRPEANAPAAVPAPDATSAPPDTSAGAGDVPTHVLVGNRALPLTHGALGFSVALHGHIALLRAAEGLTLNGTAIFRDTALEVGDRIARHGRDYLVISVET